MKSFDPIPHSGILDLIFYQTRAQFQVLGWPSKGYAINLIQLIILLILAVVVVWVTERLTKSKVGGLVAGVILTLIGAYIIQSVTTSIPDFVFEGVRVVSSLVGAIIIGVFYTLIRARLSGGGK
ncbi:MAG TPA: hypothetical protein VF808_14185 [Ktedonobacterales bacterium]